MVSRGPEIRKPRQHWHGVLFGANQKGSISWPKLAGYFVDHTSGTGEDAQQPADGAGGFHPPHWLAILMGAARLHGFTVADTPAINARATITHTTISAMMSRTGLSSRGGFMRLSY